MLVGLNIVPLRAGLMAEGAALAEGQGYSSVWLGEHLLMPASVTSEYPGGQGTQPFDEATEMLDPFLVLAHIAAATRRIRLGTGVYLLPLRHPLLTAKLIATLDALSRGRLDFGYGVGWMREEFDAVGVDFSRRGALTDEFLEVIQALLRDDVPAVTTRGIHIPPIAFEPKAPGTRIIGGGYVSAAWGRAARGDGWYGRLDRLDPATNAAGGWNLDAVASFVGDMRARVASAGGDPGAFAIIGATSRPPRRVEVDELAATGLDEIVVNPFSSVNGHHVGVATSTAPIVDYAAAISLEAGRQIT